MTRFIMPETKRLWDTFGNKLHRTKKQFYADYKLLKDSVNIGKESFNKAYPNTAKWINDCYHTPSLGEILDSAYDELIEGFGIEYIAASDTKNYTIITYVNMGDPYINTIVHSMNTFRIDCYANYVK